jgi:hypothetical protein
MHHENLPHVHLTALKQRDEAAGAALDLLDVNDPWYSEAYRQWEIANDEFLEAEDVALEDHRTPLWTKVAILARRAPVVDVADDLERLAARMSSSS